MESHQFVLKVLWLTALAVPYLVFVVHNSFRRTWVVSCRAVLAVLAGWLLLFSYAIASGAKFAFALLLGWIPAAFVVGLTWLVRSILSKRRKGSSNNGLDRDAWKPTRASG